MNEEQIKSYLERIGIAEEITPNEEGLEKLIWANLTHIPFENMDTAAFGLVPSLEDEDLYRKIVENKRGGWCFELNKIFKNLLKGLGYTCYPIAVRIIWMRKEMNAATHRATVVQIGNKKYLADVGYGGPGPKGLVVLDEGIQNIRGVQFRVRRLPEGALQLEREYQGGFAPMLYFEDKEAFEVDFMLPNFYCAKNENVIFSSRSVCNLMTEKGNIGLNGNLLTITEDGKATEKELQTREELYAGLKQYFGISLCEGNPEA